MKRLEKREKLFTKNIIKENNNNKTEDDKIMFLHNIIYYIKPRTDIFF